MGMLLPRLPGPRAEAIVRQFLDQGPDTWSGFNPLDLPEAVRFAATGGSRITTRQLQRIRSELEGVAMKHGFGVGPKRGFACFDAEIAALLAEHDLFAMGEALRDDVWSFIGAVVAPDIVHWRFGSALERYVGGVRNTFQRLWMRGRTLDRGLGHPKRWELVTELTEDAFVQIMERPSIGGDPSLALAIGEAWVRASRYHGKAAMEPIMRRAIPRIRIRNEIRCFAELPTSNLTRFLDEAFEIDSADLGAVEGIAEPSRDTQDTEVESPSFGQLPGNSAAAAGDFSASLGEAVNKVRAEAMRRRWLSTKMLSALGKLSNGSTGLDKRERNALEYLLRRISNASVLNPEVDQVRTAVSARGLSSTAGAIIPSRARGSR